MSWEPPASGELVRWPLPHQSLFNGWLLRALALLARRQVLTVHGIENVAPDRDPFILALNHSTMMESLLVPALLVLHRGGRLLHFLADWNYRLIPGVGLIYRRGETVTVTRKPAWPRILDLLKPLYLHPLSALERTRAHLIAGHSVGIFPEGKVNGHPNRLLPAHRGAALLSLQTGAPVVPAGIHFPAAHLEPSLAHRKLMAVRIGAPLFPPPAPNRITLADLHGWHGTIMREIGRLCGKAWIVQPGENTDGKQPRMCSAHR